MSTFDTRVRLAAFAWLERQVALHGDVLPRRPLLESGFRYEGETIHLLSAQGIFKPKSLDIPLSITTTAEGPYDDAFDPGGLLSYRYRGTNPGHADNAGLRRAMETATPLIYFHGVVKNRYLAVWPVYIVGDDPGLLTFTVAVDDVSQVRPSAQTGVSEPADARRRYLTGLVRIRLHQRGFRERVVRAYREHCALCRLRHAELLDAAHIIPDSESGGDPVVPNGLSLCKLHHAAFDRQILGISPDYRVMIRSDILEEEDGPMLQHGLKGLHGQLMLLPPRKAEWPDRDRLARRYERFRAA